MGDYSLSQMDTEAIVPQITSNVAPTESKMLKELNKYERPATPAHTAAVPNAFPKFCMLYLL